MNKKYIIGIIVIIILISISIIFKIEEKDIENSIVVELKKVRK